MAETMKTDASVYSTLVRNIHNRGVYLRQHKHRYLRLSYASPLIAALAAALTEAVDRLV